MAKSEHRRALVTGATGYIGSNLVHKLMHEGWEVHIITRPNSSLHLLNNGLGRPVKHVYDGSISSLHEIVTIANPDITFHLAAFSKFFHEAEDVEDLLHSNVTFPTQLIEALYRNGNRRFINTETFWQFGDAQGNLASNSLYAASKQAFHEILKFYVNSGLLSAISLVLFDTYGAGDPRPKLLNEIKRVIKKDTYLDLTPGNQMIDLVHIGDVVAAYIDAARMLMVANPPRLSQYAIRAQQRYSLKELICLIENELHTSIKVNWGAKPYRLNEVMYPWSGDVLPGWRASIDLPTGLREFFRK
ncbi:NAD-dependent epimerase/dehydratase family protein [Polynucleobacter paneuropaeus]|nr:NAD-dependent epimerase/dehydratase family protein [Polynucleobacter paneuropaeus]